MISHCRDSIWFATRINSSEDADHTCNGVKPQSFVFICTEHLKCLTKIFGIGLNIMFAIASLAALEMQVPPALSYKLTASSSQLNFEKQIQCRPTSLGWVSKIRQCNVTLSITSRYSNFDITPFFFIYHNSVRNLITVRALSSPWILGPWFVKSVNCRSVVCQEIRE